MKKNLLLNLNAATVEKITLALLVDEVNSLRSAGMTDRAIARKLDLPRWIIRNVKS